MIQTEFKLSPRAYSLVPSIIIALSLVACKVVATAFMDAYNKMVRSLRNYKAQEVKGGLGKGGKLKVGQ